MTKVKYKKATFVKRENLVKKEENVRNYEESQKKPVVVKKDKNNIYK